VQCSPHVAHCFLCDFPCVRIPLLNHLSDIFRIGLQLLALAPEGIKQVVDGTRQILFAIRAADFGIASLTLDCWHLIGIKHPVV